MQYPKQKQTGFTLVEIAIVLVVIGLLLGGVLKGQELIENSRIKAVVNDMNGISAAYNTYLDRYKAAPGDEAAGTMNARGWPGNLGGDADGTLEILATDVFLNTGEQAAMWRALRGAQLVSGDAAAAAGVATLPRAGTGGLIGVGLGVYGMAGPAVCVSGLSTKQAAGVDSSVDGPLPANNTGNNVGSLRSATGTPPITPAAAAAAATAYNENTQTNPWIVCRRM